MKGLRDFERRLIAVFRQMDGLIPTDRLANVESLVECGEPVIALENLCENIYDHDLRVPEFLAQEMAEIATIMKMTLPPWIANPDWVPPIQDN